MMASVSSAGSTALSSPSEKSKSSENSAKTTQRKMSQSAYYNVNAWSRPNSRASPPTYTRQKLNSNCTQAKIAREERLKKIRELQQVDMERRQSVLREAEEREERMRAQKEADLMERSKRVKEKEEARQLAVAERRKRLEEENNEKRQALLAKYRAQSENRQTSAKSNKPTYAFGSSTPRVLAYLQNLDADQQVYDKKLKSSPLTPAELAALPSPGITNSVFNNSRVKGSDGGSSAGSTPTRGRPSNRRPTTATDRMTQSMHVPSQRQTRPASSNPKIINRPPAANAKENVMTKSYTAGSGPSARPAPRPRGPPPSTTRTRPIAQRRSVSKAVDTNESAKAPPKRTPRDPSAPSRLTQSTAASSRRMQPVENKPKESVQPTPPIIRRRESQKQPSNTTQEIKNAQTHNSKSPREKTTAGASPPGTPPDEKRARSSEENDEAHTSQMDVEGSSSQSEECHTEVSMQSPVHSASAEYCASGSDDSVVLVTLTQPQNHAEDTKTRSSTVDSTHFINNESEPAIESGSDSPDDADGIRMDNVPTPKGIGQITEQTEDAAKAALAEKRRIAREALEREAERKREEEEAKKIEEEERAAEEEAEFRRQEAAEISLFEEMRRKQDLQLEIAIQERQRKDEEDRLKIEEEGRRKEEEDKMEKEKLEREQREKDEKFKKEQEEREERKRRLEAIKARIGKSPSSSSGLSTLATTSTPSTTLTAFSPVRETPPHLKHSDNQLNVENNSPSMNGNATTFPTHSSSALQKLANQSPLIGQLLSRHKSNPSLADPNINDNGDINENIQEKDSQDRLAQSMIHYPNSSASNEFVDPFQSASHSQQAFVQDNSTPEHVSVGLARQSDQIWDTPLDDFDPFPPQNSRTPVQDPFNMNTSNNSNNMLNGSNNNGDLLNL